MEFAEFKGEMVMREVNVSKITDAVKQLCIETNRIYFLLIWRKQSAKRVKRKPMIQGKAILK